jgi:arabinogalactan oligomer/maltooligosaccharide transport system permease protein
VTARRYLVLVVFILALAPLALHAEPLTLWHSYRGAEKDVLEALVTTWNAAHPDEAVEPLAIPNDAFANKLRTAIPQGNGPDVFLFAHNEVGNLASLDLLEPLDARLDAPTREGLFPNALAAMQYEGRLYGLPLATKSVALFYNKKLVASPPATTDELVALARRLTDPAARRFGLAYETGVPYFHAAWLFGFGGGLFDDAGAIDLGATAARAAANAASFRFVQELVRVDKVIPEEANGALVTDLFNRGLAAMVVNGPWFVGEIAPDVAYGVAPLPRVSATGLPATPFLTVEGALFPARGPRLDAALRFALFLASPESAVARAKAGQVVTTRAAVTDPRVASDAMLAGFLAQVPLSVPMDNRPLMSLVWEPLRLGLARLMRGDATPEQAVEAMVARQKVLSRPHPPAADPLWAWVILCAHVLGLGFLWVRRARASRLVPRVLQARHAYAYLAPAFAGLLLVLFVPFVLGSLIALFDHQGGTFTYVGLANFKSILFSDDYPVTSPFSLYFTLVVTLLWTLSNVALHVSIGLALALVLREPWLRLKGLYRVLLIIPWAVPNYITALIWKGMFHKQFGAINGLLVGLGLEPVSWFSRFWTAFTANLVTNTWLGFPFMMVVTLGALQAIPKDLEEAAEIDGATAWQRFTRVILPQIKPALLPAVILGSVWTFNMFNIIYLVSGGEPDGATEILITEAYKWAFERQYQYGYAAAYAMLIFLLLLAYDLVTRRLMGARRATR